MFAFSTLHKNWLPSFILSPSRRDLEFLHFALIFSPGPGRRAPRWRPREGPLSARLLRHCRPCRRGRTTAVCKGSKKLSLG